MVSNADIKIKVEQILSTILSDKYNAEITIRFKENNHGDCDTTGIIREK